MLLKNKRGQLDFGEINGVGVVGALIGGVLGLFIASRMAGGLIIKLLAFVICAVACYFIASKITSS